MVFFKTLLERALQLGLDQVEAGKLPMLAKGGFYSLMTVVSYMAIGYLSNIDKRFESIEASLVEISSKQTVDISRHDRMLINHETRIETLEKGSRTKQKGDLK